MFNLFLLYLSNKDKYGGHKITASEWLAPSLAFKQEDHLFSTVYDCLFSGLHLKQQRSPRARVSLVGSGTMLQAGRSRDQVLTRWIFFFNLPNPFSRTMALVDSASNRNEYQESSCGEKGGRRVGLTTSPPSVSRLSRQNVGTSTSHNPMGLRGLLQG
jgi:hypothetical protein